MWCKSSCPIFLTVLWNISLMHLISFSENKSWWWYDEPIPWIKIWGEKKNFVNVETHLSSIENAIIISIWEAEQGGYGSK